MTTTLWTLITVADGEFTTTLHADEADVRKSMIDMIMSNDVDDLYDDEDALRAMDTDALCGVLAEVLPDVDCSVEQHDVSYIVGTAS